MEQIKFKNVAHLYLGCNIMLEDIFNARIVGFDDKKPIVKDSKHFEKVIVNDWGLIKPILRNLEDMTEEEKIYIVENITYRHVKFSNAKNAISCFDWNRYGKKNIELCVQEFPYLLKQNFDLFNLIPSGQAIDQSTIKK